MPQYRELYAHTYVFDPNIKVWPPMNPGRNRVGLDVFEGYVSADEGTVLAAAEKTYVISRVRQSDSYDLVTGGLGVKILVPGWYEIEFEINVSGQHQIEIYEDGIGLGQLAASPVIAATGRTRISASIADLTITPADPAIILFRTQEQATGNASTAAGSRIVIRRIGEWEAV